MVVMLGVTVELEVVVGMYVFVCMCTCTCAFDRCDYVYDCFGLLLDGTTFLKTHRLPFLSYAGMKLLNVCGIPFSSRHHLYLKHD